MVSCLVLLLSFKHGTAVTVTEISKIDENNVIIGNNKEINLIKVHYKRCIIAKSVEDNTKKHKKLMAYVALSETVAMFAMHAAMVTGRVELWGCCQGNAPCPVQCHCPRVYTSG